MATNHPEYAFTVPRFVSAMLSVYRFFTILFGGLLIFAYFAPPGESLHFDDSFFLFIIPGFFYLCFIMAWAFAYSRFFRFPEKQGVLLLGVLIGATWIVILTVLEGATNGQEFSAMLIARLPEFFIGGIIAAGMQLYGMVLFMRYIYHIDEIPF